MKRILVTGATGNIGQEVVHYLIELNSDSQILAAVRNSEKAKKTFENYPDLDYQQFDFEDERTYSDAFREIDVLFLLRPPHISDVERVFRPLLSSAKQSGINEIVFLSVQGAEKSKIIPHNKIELLIRELDFKYIFVRPSYFMQNLTTTLLPEIVCKRCITLPSGNAKFNWVDVKNIAEVSAQLIMHFKAYKNEAFEITGTENVNFENIARLITQAVKVPVYFKNINPISFYFRKKKEGLGSGFALVMTILHFIPRLQTEPRISNCYQKLTGKKPTTIEEFIEREKGKLTTQQHGV